MPDAADIDRLRAEFERLLQTRGSLVHKDGDA